MRGGPVVWVSALLVIGPKAGASAGATAHTGRLPSLTAETSATEPAGKLDVAVFDHAARLPAGHALDLAAALKLAPGSSGCAVANSGSLLHAAVAH